MSSKNSTKLIIDYVTVLVILLLHFVIKKIPPHERKFSITEESISHPYLGIEQISESLLIAIISLIPIVVGIVFITLYKGNSNEYHQFILALATSIGLTIDIVGFIKLLFGRFRPDFLSRCNIDYNKVNDIIASTYTVGGVPIGENRLFDISICKNTDLEVLDEGRRSFPSGHASSTFSSFIILTLFMIGKLRIFNRRSCIWRLLVSSLPLFGAIYIVSTRYQDNLHHWSDLLAGAIIGTIVGSIVYHFFYPPVTSENSNIAYKYNYDELNVNDDEVPISSTNITINASDGNFNKLVY